MTNELTIAPVVCNAIGETSADRKMYVLQRADRSAVFALCTAGGAVGKLAREGTANAGVVGIIQHASNANYGPLASYLAASLGEAVVISGRGTYESLPDQFEQRILKIKASKSGGMREDKKTGTFVPNASLSLALRLKNEVTEIISQAAELRAKRDAERKAAEETKALAAANV